jgi:hypothetical protein
VALAFQRLFVIVTFEQRESVLGKIEQRFVVASHIQDIQLLLVLNVHLINIKDRSIP